jgi:hypothetical protein
LKFEKSRLPFGPRAFSATCQNPVNLRKLLQVMQGTKRITQAVEGTMKGGATIRSHGEEFLRCGQIESAVTDETQNQTVD